MKLHRQSTNACWIKKSFLEGKVRGLLSAARKVTICLDGWSKKGLSASFIGISANFFEPVSRSSKHVLLNLFQIEHPHTGQNIANCIEKCLDDWGIKLQNVLLVISDNGANMLKAVKLINSKVDSTSADDGEDPESSTDDDSDEYVAIDQEETEDGINKCHLVHLSCLAHSLQLVAKQVYSSTDHFEDVLKKARNVVSSIRKSSVMTQKLLQKCGKTVISDCTTRWNSTYYLVERLLEVKVHINALFNECGLDSLLTSEWNKLEDMKALLAPFKRHTDNLQSDSLSLSNVIPSLLDIECHLQSYPHHGDLIRHLLREFRKRFRSIIDVSADEFNAIPAVATLLDPTVAPVLLTSQTRDLLEAAKRYIVRMVRTCYYLNANFMVILMSSS